MLAHTLESCSIFSQFTLQVAICVLPASLERLVWIIKATHRTVVTELPLFIIEEEYLQIDNKKIKTWERFIMF